ncbi:MAG: phosphotransferase [Caldilineaceae bacterium]
MPNTVQPDVTANAHVAADEFRLLAHLHAAGLSVPKPVAYDGAVTGAASAIVLERLAGASTPAPAWPSRAARQVAAFLVRLHALADVPAFLPDAAARVSMRQAEPQHTLTPPSAKARFDHAAPQRRGWPLPSQHAPVLLHGDFWPGNVLWQDGRLTGVIDWEGAEARGDPLADVANAHTWSFCGRGDPRPWRRSRSTTWQPLRSTQTHLPYWDLCAALRPAGKLSSWGLDAATARTMRDQHRWFVTQALAKLNKPAQHA